MKTIFFKSNWMVRRFLPVTIFAALISPNSLRCQISISGSDCAFSGGSTGYLYNASGLLQASDLLSWKVTGGAIVGTSNSAVSNTSGPNSQIRVIWNSGISQGTVQLSSNRLGTFSLSVKVASLTNSITSATSLVKSGSGISINANSIYGGCYPLCSYWWEIASSPNGPFVPIGGQENPTLSLDSATAKSYFRRAFSANGDVVYSNTIMIDVQ